MRFLYFCMFLSMTLVIIELVKDLTVTRRLIKSGLEKIEILKEILKRYDKDGRI